MREKSFERGIDFCAYVRECGCRREKRKLRQIGGKSRAKEGKKRGGLPCLATAACTGKRGKDGLTLACFHRRNEG